MSILIVLIPLAFLLLAVAIAAFAWAVHNDQFEDLDEEGKRILFGDDGVRVVSRDAAPPPSVRE